jgi:DNA replication protein DnaC
MNTSHFDRLAGTLEAVMPDFTAMPANIEADKAERREITNEMRAFWESSQVPKRHIPRPKSENSEWVVRRDQILGYLGKGAIIVLTGKRGTGKTQLGVEAIRHTCYLSKAALYCQAMDVFLSLREAMGLKDKSERNAIEPYLKPSMLVIDALEERGESQWEDRMLNHLIDKRYGALKDTILITNQSKAALAESIGPSIVSRVHETGEVIECLWDSFRERKV